MLGKIIVRGSVVAAFQTCGRVFILLGLALLPRQAHAQISGFGGVWSLNGSNSYSVPMTVPAIQGGVLTVTDTMSSGYEQCSAFYQTSQPIGSFVAQFTYQASNFGTRYPSNPYNYGGDGLTFCIQNSGVSACGLWGEDLGYSNGQLPNSPAITPSVAVALNIYNGTGPGENLLTNGANPYSYNSTAPVALRSQNPINVTLNYVGSTLQETLVDQVTGAYYANNYTLNIPSIVGGNTAYVGFTGGNGAAADLELLLPSDLSGASVLPA